ncbi:hypothetical protein ACFVR1_13770 [Psychrobacillus sp. NPDC058041]|uniref:hypothetical protein n=1 Tax=Psychrobacillus sp. NPDC058041 TaxID=3346310 RepID=UPI0036D7DBAC
MDHITDEELYESLKEDLIDELKEKYALSIEIINEVLIKNKFKDRFLRNSKQFDYIEPEEVAAEFYKTYKHLKGLNTLEIQVPIKPINKSYAATGKKVAYSTVAGMKVAMKVAYKELPLFKPKRHLGISITKTNGYGIITAKGRKLHVGLRIKSNGEVIVVQDNEKGKVQKKYGLLGSSSATERTDYSIIKREGRRSE